MNKVKVAVIGVGNISECHIESYKANPNVELYAFCDIDKDRLEQKGKYHGVTRLFTDEGEMFQKHPEIDAVSVCTWNKAHAECTIKALQAGKHVLCEKPMAASVEAAIRMNEAAKKSGKILQIGFVCRYARNCIVVKDLAQQDFFGDFYYAKANYLRKNGSPDGWFSDKALSSGGPLIDLGVHIIDLTRYLMGNPKPVSVYGATYQKLQNRPDIKYKEWYGASRGREEEIFDVEDLAVAVVRYDNDAVLEINTSYSLNIGQDEYSQELFGTKGGVKMTTGLELYKNFHGYLTNMILTDHEYYDNEDHMFEEEINHFIDCIINGSKCIAPAEDGIEIMRILDGIYQSAKSKHEVILS